jgi:hypothetical protein
MRHVSAFPRTVRIAEMFVPVVPPAEACCGFMEFVAMYVTI